MALSSAAMLSIAAGAVAQQIATGATEIDIKNFGFDPETLTVAAGTAVTWVNQDEEPHSIVNLEQPRVFRSAGIDGGEKYSFVLDKPEPMNTSARSTRTCTAQSSSNSRTQTV